MTSERAVDAQWGEIMTALTETADRQSLWSKTAGTLKSEVDVARWSTFLLSILGALLATIASQLDQPQLRLYVAIAGAIVLAIMSFLTARLLSGAHVTNWVRTRAASEALKRAAYTRAAGAAPYNDPLTRDAQLNKERNRIEEEIDDLTGLQVPTKEPGSSPRADLTRDEYATQRVRVQIDEYYLPQAKAYQRMAKNLRLIELVLSLFATIITAVVGVAGKEALGFKFDFVAITAVLTTVAGAILAHIEASRYDFLVTTYRATARRLTNELTEANNLNAMSPADWSAFVDRCETIISEENANWVAKWSKPPR
jgi:SMODS and SLOG-associating 2TM effector domain 1/Protein of unknown function (DUF4231)